MFFKVQNLKYKYIRRIYSRHFIVRLGRIFLLALLISIFIFMQTLRKYNHINTQTYLNHDSLSIIIKDFNTEEKIQNLERYGKLEEDAIIFAVLTDGYSKEFKTFLVSLLSVKDINKTFIIFSHYYYDETLNKNIKGIDFCRVLQIYYPFSVQTTIIFPNVDLKPNEEVKITQSTENADAYFLDHHGHYKNGKKHHWWWTANQVFERLGSTKKHTGLVIFMTDDLMLTNDFIHMMTFMRIVARSLPQCEFLSIGTHSVLDNTFGKGMDSVKLTEFDPKAHSSVLAFDITTWDVIAAHYDIYCELKEPSWIRSLHYISNHRMDSLKFKVLSSVTPRAFKISPCRWFCDKYFRTNDDILQEYHNENADSWFPSYLQLKIDLGEEARDEPIEPMSLADPDDSALCHNITISKIKKSLMAINI